MKYIVLLYKLKTQQQYQWFSFWKKQIFNQTIYQRPILIPWTKLIPLSNLPSTEYFCLHFIITTCQKSPSCRFFLFHKSFPNILNIISIFLPLKPHPTVRVPIALFFCTSHWTPTIAQHMSWRQELSFVIFVSSPASSAASLFVVRELNIHVLVNISSVWNLES